MVIKFEDKIPKIDSEAWISDTASIIGDVNLEKDSSVWPGAVLRGDDDNIYIGERTNIQDNAVLHVDVNHPIRIGKGTTVGHNVTAHGCTIGDNVVIGMGSIILNDAVIGDNTIIAAGSLITQGKEIPENSLVMGVPGKVVRQLSDEEIEKNIKDNDHYVRKSKRFKNGSEEILWERK